MVMFLVENTLVCLVAEESHAVQRVVGAAAVAHQANLIT
jgi:hypothetical protein